MSEKPLSGVGPRLRSLRSQRRVTLSNLSETTGISVSTLSRLESGQRRPTLELLMPLAQTYGVTLDELVDAPATGDPRVHMRPIRRHGALIIPLTEKASGVGAYKYILPATDKPATPDPRTHEGYEWLYVLSGKLRLVLGDEELILVPGEAAEFSTRLPHWMGNATAEAVEFIALFGPQGERAHLRARPAPRPRT
ncbi:MULTISPECIES: XRE family transcriptional regulator [unclassified Arthrobacter]|uniref:helix-turn-helix domain-containing protein n=1 Tax=unclassified Arthrobacter TaxID=235627 RepID=UPI001E3EEA1E|nr:MULTISPECIES: XRE family transcriptional regulator [unclassified Arthrobacter]MCC9145240.1 XRE family transcriptional regulator [Arthrobacter sp. zg-Y919]MDK1276468.1 XRE family transcriptional regulator [Arthrobacter sp. zg.Y919]WIB01933.1 XRE family transcriptional regulator [Arthrobacter sp. zg-Y919]